MQSDAVQQVRRFNRLVTRRVGALEESYLSRGRPLSEARLIFETGLAGADVRALRGRLGLDSGYMSRLLRSLAAQDLVAVERQAGDARVRRVTLTARGCAEFEAYERLSDALAGSMLEALEGDQRERLVAAMAEVERLIRAGSIEVRQADAGSAEAAWCLQAYFGELAERFESGFNPANGNAVSEREMTPPRGWFFLARLDGEPAGCGALLRVDGTTAEIKRMWTAPSARGLGVARRILATIEVTARGAGMTALRLDTNSALNEAQALYRKLGFAAIERFNDNPYAHHWFAKRL